MISSRIIKVFQDSALLKGGDPKEETAELLYWMFRLKPIVRNDELVQMPLFDKVRDAILTYRIPGSAFLPDVSGLSGIKWLTIRTMSAAPRRCWTSSHLG
jgi:hypothetical protein